MSWSLDASTATSSDDSPNVLAPSKLIEEADGGGVLGTKTR